MKKLLAAALVAISMATWAEGGKLVSIDEIDCTKAKTYAIRKQCEEDKRKDAEDKAREIAQSKWSYSSHKDEMRGTELEAALLNSTNKATLEFPYGEAEGILMVLRNEKGEMNIVLGVSDGQVNCENNVILGPTSCQLEASIDGDQTMFFTERNGQKNRAFVVRDFLEMEHRAKTLEKIRKGKKMIVEFPMYGQQAVQFKFDLAGFQW